ncbi:fungal specific transcription factor domain-containing protein [Kluyveromyces lactis]|uniref:KLLA0A03399p n=1 Tax=Kluyveromyces lactis (strain ATCC 8585 / CBS 2359 / DSM 70799 / NBRC 1267 / NRRL Y-1140 / WM37) TaxID=284590 RepID=Q6CY40_KLULA|nr:uncharacterized protein KLLA0_A03399g [Kluyveromyces lactis]CAH02737.1 KLLA0A03399p [Kluyveromyces lactis]|eukprot:XP_451149.1 uncharacterized protein KLLA0_A03399g [Kluyveromyces lactis]
MGTNATLKELEKEVEYWRNLALGIEPEQDPVSNVSTTIRTSVARLSATKDLAKTDGIRLNFYESFPHLVTKGIIREDIGPFAVNYMLFPDPYISIFIKFVFQTPYRKTLNTYLGTPDSYQEFNVSSILKILKLNPSAFEKLNPLKKKKVSAFIEQILAQNQPASENSNSELFLATLNTMTAPRFIEDKCLYGQYSPILLAYIGRIQNDLPSLPNIRLLLDNFYHHIYPIWPCIDIDLFEENLNEVIHMDSHNPERIIVNPGTTNIKMKLVNISILYLILQLSISHWKLRLFDQRAMEQDVQHKYDGDRAWIEGFAELEKKLTSSAAELVSILNIYQSRTEEVISWHMLLWNILAHQPDLCSIFYDSTSEGVIGMMGPLVSDLGLDRDPSQFLEPTGNMRIDPRYKNYRRRLWLCYCLISRFEITVKGRTPQKSTANVQAIPGIMDQKNGWEEYSCLYKKDMLKQNEAELELLGLFYRHLQFMTLFLPYDKLLKDNLNSLTLTEVEQVYEGLERYLEKDVNGTFTHSQKWARHSTIDYSYNLNDVDNVFNMAKQLIARSVRLTICDLLIRFFNSRKVHNSFDMEQSLLYCQKALADNCEGIGYLIKYFALVYNENIRTTGKFFTNRISQILLSRCTLHTTLTILRVDHMLGLSKRRSNQESFLYEDQSAFSRLSGINEQRQQCVRIRMQLFSLLENLCSASSEELRYNYISGFRYALLTDCAMHFLKQNGKRFLMRDILMSNIGTNEDSAGFMETSFHLLSSEEKENILLSANEFVHFDEAGFRLLLDTVNTFCTNSGSPNNRNTMPEQLFGYTATSSNVLINQFSVDLAGLSANFDFVFDGGNLP